METNELLKKIRHLEIRAKGLTRHIFSGEYHSAFKGRGMAFSEVRDYQFDAIAKALDINRCVLLSPTGSGKSLIIYLLARYYDTKTVIIVPTTSLVEQMTKDFQDYGYKEPICKIYSGQEVFDAPITVTTWQSFAKAPKEVLESFDVVVGDEAHLFKANVLKGILEKMKKTAVRIGCTGTLDGTEVHRLQLEGLFGPVKKVISTAQLIEDGTIASLNIDVIVLKHQKRKFENYQEEMDYIVTHEKRNKLITNLALDQKGNTLVLFQFVEKHGKVLFDMMRDKAEEGRKIFYVSGEVDAADREQIRGIVEGQKNAIIVASLGTFSTGINIRNLHNIVFASPSKSQIKVLQSIGRGLRNSDDGSTTTLYDIADDLHWKSRKNYTLVHSAERIKIYARESFNYKIYEIELKT